MSKKIVVKELIKQMKTSLFLLYCEMPMGYVEGLPVLQIRNGQLCLTIPFLRYQLTGETDKTLVYPIRFTVTVLLPEGKVVGFEDLKLDSRFARVDFTKPVGLFRHEAIKHMKKAEYSRKRDQLLAMYDKVIGALLYGEAYTQEEDEAMRKLLQTMIEPSLLPIYKALDEDFYEKYLN